VEGRSVVGVVTSTDLMTFAAALSGVPTERELIGDAMDAPIERADEADLDPDADSPAAYFYEMWDDAGADTSARISAASSPEWNALEEHDVSEVMTRSPLVMLPVDATAEEAAGLMRRNRIHRILVTENGTLAGIVSALDIAGAVADHRFTTRMYVFDHPRGGP
jgi:CBS domain-containing protein